MAGPLSRRKSAIVLKSGARRPRQPRHLDIALAFALKTPARGHPVQIPVDIDLEHHARVVGRAAGDCGHGAVEAERREVQFVHEHVHDSDRVVLADVVIDAFGK